MAAKLYPVGIQTFSKIRESDYLYVDKTEYVYRMTHSGSNYVFLSRPRRFGKSLLVSTLRSYFEGQKELFSGLAIEKLEKDWTPYPVVHISFASIKHANKESLEEYINYILTDNAHRLGLDIKFEQNQNIGLMMLVKAAYKKYSQKVVVLIDEYEAPLFDVVHEDEHLQELQQIMCNFYSPLKDLDPYLRFVFMTGITKFLQQNIFSKLNNIKNINLLEEYGAVCGITEEELETQLSDGIESLAQKMNITKDEAMKKLKDNYDGYHFCLPSPDIYNPFSLMMAFEKKKIGAYWFGSGTPTYLIEMLRKFNVEPTQLGAPEYASAEDFDAPTERMTSIVALLYQSGYITIKDCDKSAGLYTLNIPNKEIRIGMMKSLLPNYLGQSRMSGNTTAALMQDSLLNDDIDGMLNYLKTFLATVPYTDNTAYEGHYQQMLYVIFSILGAHVDVEVRTARGRVDMVARTANRLYLFELKIGKDANVAASQIDLKQYPERFTLENLPIVKVGINFSVEERNITDWKVTE